MIYHKVGQRKSQKPELDIKDCNYNGQDERIEHKRIV